MTAAGPVQVAILFDPKSQKRGAGVAAVEALASEWLGMPVTLAHREDGSPIVIGATDKHFSLSHGPGLTAIALASAPIGIDITEVSPNTADGKVAASLFSAAERSWLGALPADHQPYAFAQLWTLKEALLKRDRRGLDANVLPDLDGHFGDLPIRNDVQRATPHRVPFPMGEGQGEGLIIDDISLRQLGTRPLAVAILAAPNSIIALAIAWTMLTC